MGSLRTRRLAQPGGTKFSACRRWPGTRLGRFALLAMMPVAKNLLLDERQLPHQSRAC